MTPGIGAPTSPSIAFLRPRMVIGGSERLAIDAAVQLQRLGCHVRIVIPQGLHGPQFSEVSDGAVAVEEVRTRIPEQIAGRCRAPLTILRTLSAARVLGGRSAHDVVFCDVVSHVVPFVKRLTKRPVLFYCHFPDLLLGPGEGRRSIAYDLYRRPVDRLERAGLRAADRIVVNSQFTASKVQEVFPEFSASRLAIVHPGVPIRAESSADDRAAETAEIVILSVSRFDPLKNLGLAVDAIAALRELVPHDVFARVRLVLAGRYDSSQADQAAVLRDLENRSAILGVAEHVRFVLSPTSEERDRLYGQCRCVVYTPSAEHFGYVPLEAMAGSRPVVASDRGGPSETVVHGQTGLLCSPDAQSFAAALARLVIDVDLARALGQAARDHVRRHFSIEAFGHRLWDVMQPLLTQRHRAGTGSAESDGALGC